MGFIVRGHIGFLWHMVLGVVLWTILSVDFGFARGLTESRLARLDPATETTSVLLESVKELLKNDQYSDALPFLSEIFVRLEDDEDKRARRTLAFTLYQLAECQMKLDKYVQASSNFILFAEKFPEDQQAASARILAAQCLTMVQQWSAARKQAAKVLEDKGLDDEQKVAASKLLAEALYHQEKWGEAVKPLTTLFRLAKTDTVRTGAAVMMVTCHVRLNDFANLFQLLPRCDDAARHDVGLNVALLEGGDAHYNNGEFLKALMLYRLVLLKRELLAYYENALLEKRRAMKPFVAGGAQTLSDFKEQQRRDEAVCARLERHYRAVEGFQDYDMDVGLRIAQCYGDLGRNWPAHAIYQRIHTENPSHSLADQARFSAFAAMLSEREWPLAVAEGYEYVEKLPQGEFIDDVTLGLMQVHMQQDQFDLAYEMGRKGLELSPNHKYIDQVKYLMGYICFLQIEYDRALELFSEVLAKWPESRHHESAEYWRAMSLLFLARFEEAVSAFDAYLANPKYDPRIYAEDASYRLGIAQYGADQFQESESTLRAFVETYPDSLLLPEVYAMLGDLRGAEGDLEVALEFYRLAREKALDVSQVDYPLFQSAKVLELKKDYAGILALMAAYLEQWGERADFANAANWQGKSYKALDEYPRALDAYLVVVDAFGDDADLAGVDIVLNEIIDDYRNEDWKAFRDVVLEKLDLRLKAAKASGSRTLQLRYQTVFARILTGSERDAFVDAIVRPRNVPAAGSGTLVLIAREGVKRKQFEIVHEAYRRFLSIFDISNDMLYMMNANLDALVEEGSYEDALVLSEEILLRFGYSKSVGWARKRRGDVFRLQRKYDSALEAYKEVLSIREWRGPLTPEALYYSGICKMEQGRTAEAFAYFQRVYVLYEEYVEWVVPAYEKSILCLEILGGREQEIINTCKEMLANDRVAATPEGRAAFKRLQELEPVEETP